MARIIWSREALFKLRGIHGYIRQFNPGAATTLSARLLAAAESLSDFPNRGRLTTGKARELVSIRPYIIVYQVVGDEVTILDIRHAAQQSLD